MTNVTATVRTYSRGEGFYARYPHLRPSEQLAKKAAEVNGRTYVAPTPTRKVDSRTVILNELVVAAVAKLKGKAPSTTRYIKRNFVKELTNALIAGPTKSELRLIAKFAERGLVKPLV